MPTVGKPSGHVDARAELVNQARWFSSNNGHPAADYVALDGSHPFADRSNTIGDHITSMANSASQSLGKAVVGRGIMKAVDGATHIAAKLLGKGAEHAAGPVGDILVGGYDVYQDARQGKPIAQSAGCNAAGIGVGLLLSETLLLGALAGAGTNEACNYAAKHNASDPDEDPMTVMLRE